MITKTLDYVEALLGYIFKGNERKNKQIRLHQTKKLLHIKGTINKMKRQSIKWEKMFANHVSDKRFTSKSIKSPYNSTAKQNLIKR